MAPATGSTRCVDREGGRRPRKARKEGTKEGEVKVRVDSSGKEGFLRKGRIPQERKEGRKGKERKGKEGRKERKKGRKEGKERKNE